MDKPPTLSYQYRNLLSDVLHYGIPSGTRQGPPALTGIQKTMRFNLAAGFPIITERDIRSFWRSAIGELCAFINGATSLEEFEKFGCNWWGPWATEAKTVKKGIAPGTLGPGSYGGAFHDFPTSEGPGFDQFAHLVEQIREFPEDRTHFVTPWIPQYQTRGTGKTPKTTISPCHGWVHVRIIRDQLYLHMFQRSGDLPVGVPSNMVQYSALALMLEHLTGYKAVSYHHTISDAHIYTDQIDAVCEMLDREPRPLPSMILTDEGKAVNDIHDFRAEHFELIGYTPHPGIRNIPVAI